MWLINRKLKGVDPPPALAPEMVPPSMRSGKADVPAVSVLQFNLHVMRHDLKHCKMLVQI